MAIQTLIIYPRDLEGNKSKDNTIAMYLPLKRDCDNNCQDANDNCPTCDNDFPYYQYVTCEDQLHLQFNLIDNWNTNPLNPTDGWKDGWLDISIVTLTQEIIISNMSDICANWMVGATEEGLTFQNLIIDMSKLCLLIGSEKCFYFKISNCSPGFETPDYITERCANLGGNPPSTTSLPIGFLYFDNVYWQLWQWDGTTWNLVNVTAGQIVYCILTGVFYERSGDQYIITENPYENPDPENPKCTYCYTDLFRIKLCEELIKFSATWAEDDCLGFYHGTADNYAGSSNFAYEPTFNVHAYLETVGFPTEETRTEEGTLTSKLQKEAALFRSFGMPKNAVKKISNYLMQKYFYLNDELWETHSEIQKNNDNGHNWWLEITFEREICERKSFDCD